MAKRQRGKKRGVAAVDKSLAKIQGPGLTKTDASEVTSPPKSALPENKTSDLVTGDVAPVSRQCV